MDKSPICFSNPQLQERPKICILIFINNYYKRFCLLELYLRINLLFYLFFHHRPIQQLCVSFEETSTPTRHVENVVLTTKGLQERNT